MSQTKEELDKQVVSAQLKELQVRASRLAARQKALYRDMRETMLWADEVGVTKAEIARLLGRTRESVSREMSILKREQMSA